MTDHDLKTWPTPFEAILRGEKTHEIRKNDRPFRTGDRLVLREWDPGIRRYTGRVVVRRVTYLTRGGEWGIPPALCVMSIAPVEASCPTCEDVGMVSRTGPAGVPHTVLCPDCTAVGSRPVPWHDPVFPVARIATAERQPRPGERCSCGLPARTVYVTAAFGEVPSCR